MATESYGLPDDFQRAANLDGLIAVFWFGLPGSSSRFVEVRWGDLAVIERTGPQLQLGGIRRAWQFKFKINLN